MLYLRMPETPKKQRARGNEANFGKLLSSLQNGSAVQQEMIAARVRAGLTQAQLALRMGTTRGWRLENLRPAWKLWKNWRLQRAAAWCCGWTRFPRKLLIYRAGSGLESGRKRAKTVP